MLLVDAGCRPSGADVRNLLAELDRTSISFDPAPEADASIGQDAERWLEVLKDGLTFDLLGLAPGPGVQALEPRHRFGFSAASEDIALEAIGLFPGPHLAEGAHTLPIVRTMLALGAQLASAIEGARRIVWTPAGCALEASLFERLISAWLDGGAFPAPGLVGFEPSDDGGLRSDGLAFFTNRELVVSPQLCVDRVAASRLASRIIHEIVGFATQDMPEMLQIPGGPTVALRDEPDRDVMVAGPV